MAEFIKDLKGNDRVRLTLDLDGPLIQNMGAKTADLEVTHSTLLAAAIDWYRGPLGDAYRPLEQLPSLPERPEMTNFPANGSRAHFLLHPEDYSHLEEQMAIEQLTPEELGLKALACYLHGVRADELDMQEIYDRYPRNAQGFIRGQGRRPDPRAEGLGL